MNRRRIFPAALVLVTVAFACMLPRAVPAQSLGVVFQAPAPGATVNGGVAVQFESFGGADPGADSIVQRHVVLTVDKSVVLNETRTVPFSHQEVVYLWPSTEFADGPHVFEVKVTDELGATATATMSLTAANGGAAPAAQNVAWTSPVNVTVSGNTITKNTGCNGCADAGAASRQAIASGDGAVEFTVSSGLQGTVGLSVGNPGTGATEIMFGLRFYSGYVEVREGGAYKADWPLTAGAIHKIAVAGGVVKYFQAGVLKYTSARAPIYPLLVDASLNALGASVQNALITTSGGGGATPASGSSGSAGAPGNVTWTSAVNVAVSGNTITKNAGCSGCADAGAVSQQMIVSGNGSVTFTASTGAEMTVGLGSGHAGTGTNDIAFGLRFYPSGYVEVRESGVYKWDFAIVAGATYTVAVENGVVKYYQNGALKYTSAKPPAYPLLVDTSLNSVGAAVKSAVLGP